MLKRRSSFVAALLPLIAACGGNEGAPGPVGVGGSSLGGAAGSGVGVAGSAGDSSAAGSSTTGGGGVSSGGQPSGGSASTGGTDAGGVGGAGGAAGSGGAGGSGGGETKPDVAFCGDALDAAAVQLAGFRDAYKNPASIPRSAKGGKVSFVGISDWTSGFFGGVYWYIYEHTKDQAFRTAAEAATKAIENQKNDKGQHDTGFQIMSTYGNGYRLTQNEAYLGVIKTTAASLATRFRMPVGAIQSWESQGQWSCPVIIDNMMNLHLLYFTSANNGGASYAELATKHADTTLKNHFRADNSSFHLVNYDKNNGAVLGKQTVQGLADDTAWARGQSWGLYGYVESYVATQKPEYLAQAKKIAAFVMNHKNMPADKVPYWDYDAPDRQGASTVRDASAAAIMASSLLELAGLVQAPESTTYRDYALDILKSLSSDAYAAAPGENSYFVLKHSTGHLPANVEIDAAINYADYYYLEALLRCQALAAP